MKGEGQYIPRCVQYISAPVNHWLVDDSQQGIKKQFYLIPSIASLPPARAEEVLKQRNVDQLRP